MFTIIYFIGFAYMLCDVIYDTIKMGGIDKDYPEAFIMLAICAIVLWPIAVLYEICMWLYKLRSK